MNPEIRLLDKTFSPYLSEDQIKDRIETLAKELERDYSGKSVIFLSVLNGAFMFTSDLMKRLDINLEISFVKLSSYQGTKTSGVVRELIGLNKNIKGLHVVIIEDITVGCCTASSVVTTGDGGRKTICRRGVGPECNRKA